MTASLKYSFYKNVKNLCVLLCVITHTLLLPTSVFACSRAFQEILPEQLKARLLLVAPNKTDVITNLDINSSIPRSLSFSSKTGTRFQIRTDSSFKEPEIEISSSSKVLTIPSYEWLNNGSSETVIKRWLTGHEAHPYTTSKIVKNTEAQNTAAIAFKQSLKEGAESFLHIAPTSAGKTLVMAQALKEKLQNYRKGKISFVTADQTKLVDQLFEAMQLELTGMNVTVINWNNRSNKDFYVEVERSVRREQPTVFVITSQSLKSQLERLQREQEKDYTRLVENTDSIYIDEAHHLGAFYTKSALLTLRERSGAFLYGTTATPVHHQVNLRDFFAREHWSYLNTLERGNLFTSHPAEKVVEQLSIGIERGEITPFDTLYIIGESSFNTIKDQPLFIQPVNNQLRILNTHYYNRVVSILHPILSSNRKGFIVTATIAEANRLAKFLSEAIEGVKFESYHSEMKREQREEVLRNSEKMESHYIVAVRALDEGVNLPHLSAYIDLNVNVSVKQMVHRIGRVLRLHPDKLGADILFLADYKSEQMAKDLLNLLDVIDRTAFRGGIVYRGESRDMGLRAPEVEPITREELRKLRKELRQTVQSFWDNRNKLEFLETKEEAYELIKKENVKSKKDFWEKRKTNPELQRIPVNPDKHYEGWSWREATGKVKPEFLKTKKEAYELIKKENVKSQREFLEKRKTNPELQRIPTHPDRYYEGWSWYEATGRVKPEFLETKKEAYELIKKENVKSQREFLEKRETNPELQRIPVNPYTHYEGWSWKEATGKPEFLKTKKEAYELIKKENVKSQREFLEKRETNPELQRIPVDPYTHYEGWSWKEATGKPEFLKTKKEAYELSRRKNVKSKKDFLEKRKTDPELQRIPVNPYTYYEGWSWREAIGQ